MFFAGGAPLLLSTLLSTGILRGDHPVSGGSRDNALLMDSNSPFPLLQQTEHPTTGDVVWSVHPCQVSAAVDEVLRAEGIRGTERGNEREGLRWLEAWMMRSDEVVDLSYP